MKVQSTPKRLAGESDTKLARFIADHQLSTSRFSRVADVNPTYFGDVKAGRSEPTRPVMERIRRAAELLLGRPVQVDDLFEFGSADVTAKQRRVR